MTSAANTAGIPAATCGSCGRVVRAGSRYCGSCGTTLDSEPAADTASRTLGRAFRPLTAVGLVVALVLSLIGVVSSRYEAAKRHRDVSTLRAQFVSASQQISVLERQNATLAARLGATEKNLTQAK